MHLGPVDAGCMCWQFYEISDFAPPVDDSRMQQLARMTEWCLAMHPRVASRDNLKVRRQQTCRDADAHLFAGR